MVSPASFYALINFLKYSETIFKVSKEQKEIIKIFGSLKEQWGKYLNQSRIIHIPFFTGSHGQNQKANGFSHPEFLKLLEIIIFGN